MGAGQGSVWAEVAGLGLGRLLGQAGESLTIRAGVPLQHEVHGIHGPGRGVVAEAQGWRLGACHLEQLGEGAEDLGLGTGDWVSGLLGPDPDTWPWSSR